MKKYDVVCAGLTVINFPIFPVDETIFQKDLNRVERIELLPGGDAANQAIVLSRLGAKAALAARTGRDSFGKMLHGLIREAAPSLDLSRITVDDKNGTAVCAMMICPDGQRHFCIHRGAMLTFNIDDIDRELLQDTKVVSIGGLMSLPGLDGQGTAEMFFAAKKNGAVTVADTKKDLWGIGLEGIRSTLAYTDYFFPSVDEARDVSKKDKVEDMADVFLQAGAAHVGIKLGSKGCYFKSKTEEFYLPACKCDVVDTTGSGDNFMAGFITGLLKGFSHRECCRFAAACGAICAQAIGPNSGVKSIEQVMEYYRGETDEDCSNNRRKYKIPQ